MRGLLLGFVFLFGLVGHCLAYGGCSADYGTGTCMSTSDTCYGYFVPGYCPGPDYVQCCVDNWGDCTVNGVGGTCELTSTCSGTPYSGYCPGPEDVQCCVSGAPPPPPPPPPPSDCAGTAAANANYIGESQCPYVADASGPCDYGYDCSGMVLASYSSCLPLYHGSIAQCENYGYDPGCTIDDLDNCWEPGDLLCFSTDEYLGHVGMYVGGGYVVDCLNTNYGCVKWNSDYRIFSYYQQTFAFGKRIAN